MVHRQQRLLIFLAEQRRDHVVHSADGVGAVFRKEDGLLRIFFRPAFQLILQHDLRQIETSLLRIPAEIPVEAEHIDKIGNLGGFGRRAAVLHDGDRAVLRIAVARQLDKGPEIFSRAVLLAGRLVRHRPHHHARVILIAGDHLADHFLMVLRRLHLRPCAVRLAAEHPGGSEACVQPDSRDLVDHKDALAVAEHHHFLRVGIMAGAERIRADPLEQVDIPDIHCAVEAASVDGAVLVLSEALEIERLAVEQEAAAAHLRCADTKRLAVDVVAKGDCQRIQVRVRRLPQHRGIDFQPAVVSPRDDASVGVLHKDEHFALAAAPDLVGNLAVQSRLNGDILNVIVRRGVNLHRAHDPRVVVEIEVWIIARNLPDFGIAFGHETAGREGGVVHTVIDRNGEQIAPGARKAVEAHLERQEPALMLAQKIAVETDPCRMRHRAETQHQAAHQHLVGDVEIALVEHPADMVADLRIHSHVVIGTRNRHGPCVGQLPFRPFFLKTVPVIQLEIPDAVKTDDGAAFTHLRIQHIRIAPFS